MILKLILLDIKVHKNLIFYKIMLAWLIGGAFIYRFYTWDAYMFHTCMTLAAAAIFYFIAGKKGNSEILIISLPVTRTAIVVAKYLTSAVIIVLGLIVWPIFARAIDWLFIQSVTRYDDVFNLKVISIVLFFIAISISLCLPAVFRFKSTVSILALVLSIAMALFATAYTFHPDKRSFVPFFTTSDVWVYFVIVSAVFLLPLISIVVSSAIYRRMDL
jgi:hypothetical protein